jgi:hypothetical protein
MKIKNLSNKLTGLFILLITISILIPTFLMVSKPNITYPKTIHTHFMIKLYNNGSIYKTNSLKAMSPSDQTLCSGLITSEPMHFHDNVEDMVHLHWQGITGGQFLKYLGANYIGGFDSILGIRLDKLKELKIIPIRTTDKMIKPYPDSLIKIYIKRVNSEDYENMSLHDFLKLQLSELDPVYKASSNNTKEPHISILDYFNIESAYAHNDEGDLDGDGNTDSSTNNTVISKPTSLSSTTMPRILFYMNQANDISKEQLKKDDSTFTKDIAGQCNG